MQVAVAGGFVVLAPLVQVALGVAVRVQVLL
jgi:hypothetical protein